jgi:hypothetical protein
MLRVPSRAARCSAARKVPSLYKRGEIQEPRRGRLREKGARVVVALCGGRTVHEPPDSAFALLHEELEDYTP